MNASERVPDDRPDVSTVYMVLNIILSFIIVIEVSDVHTVELHAEKRVPIRGLMPNALPSAVKLLILVVFGETGRIELTAGVQYDIISVALLANDPAVISNG